MLRFTSLFFLVFTITCNLFAQVQTPRYNTTMNQHALGFYEYLPQGYATGNFFPVIIAIHGQGQTGDGGTGADGLIKVRANGPSKVINDGQFPTSFTVNGQTHKFIVISPQFTQWPNFTDVNEIINYVIANYKVNQNRIYLTGLSMGGGAVWDYAGQTVAFANRLAGIVPVCGASFPENTRARNMAAANLPVLATHNRDDPTVPSSYTTDYVNRINAAPPPNPLALKYVWTDINVTSHDAWTRTYNPNNKIFGINNNLSIYEWMLQYQRNIQQIPLPVVLSHYSAILTAVNTVKISWTTTFEQNNDYFTIERSVDGVNFTLLGQVAANNISTGSNYNFEHTNPAAGDNYYRLSQTDIDRKITVYSIHKVRISSIESNTVLLYPNPVRDNLSIRMTNSYSGELTIGVINSSGSVSRNVKVAKIGASLQQGLSIAELPAGYYTLEIKGLNYSYSAPFIKQ